MVEWLLVTEIGLRTGKAKYEVSSRKPIGEAYGSAPTPDHNGYPKAYNINPSEKHSWGLKSVLTGKRLHKSVVGRVSMGNVGHLFTEKAMWAYGRQAESQ